MTRSTASRRARNSDSVMIGGRRRPESRPSRRRCRLASSRVEPRTGWTSPDGARPAGAARPHVHDGVRRVVGARLVGVLRRGAAPCAACGGGGLAAVLVRLGALVGFRGRLRRSRPPPARRRSAAGGSRRRRRPPAPRPSVPVFGVGALAARAATPADGARRALAVAARPSRARPSASAVPAPGPVVAGCSGRRGGPAAGVRRPSPRRGGWKITWGGWKVAAGTAGGHGATRPAQGLPGGRIAVRVPGRRRGRRTPAVRLARRSRSPAERRPTAARPRRFAAGCPPPRGLADALMRGRRRAASGCRGGGVSGRPGRVPVAGRLAAPERPGQPTAPASLRPPGPHLADRRPAPGQSTGAGAGRCGLGRCCICWRAGAAALPHRWVLAIVQLGLEHPGNLPSGSRARRTQRTRRSAQELVARARWEGAGHVAGPLRARCLYLSCAAPGAALPRGRSPDCVARRTAPGHSASGGSAGHVGRWPPRQYRQVALAPAGSPAVVTTARGRPPAECGQDVVGSHGRCHMPNNHSKYRIPGGLLSAARRSVSMLITAARASMRLLPLAVRRSTSRAAGGQEGVDGRGQRPPVRPRGAQPASATPPAGAGERTPAPSITSITSIPSGRAASSRSRTSASGARLGEADLQVLGLTRCPGGGSASVRDLRVRREPGGIGDGQPCPANSPFNGARDVPVAGETHPASLSVPDNHAGSDGKHTAGSGAAAAGGRGCR